MTKEKINELFGIKESFELPAKLMPMLLEKDAREKLFREFRGQEENLSKDVFRDYFQENHSNRKDLKQDYTPDCICELIARLQQDEIKTITDICSGTGALIISSYKSGMTFQCEEISSRAIPILLFNLAIRNFDGVVLKKDVLKNEVETSYRLTKGEEFSNIEEVETYVEEKADVVISNPPYSLSWEQKNDERFEGYGLAPKTAADYAFVLDALYRLNEEGQAIIVLPHGLLFRGKAEGEIRKKLIENNLIDTIISLPEKLFLNTDIPVLIMILKKKKDNTDVLVIDATKNFIKVGKNNKMTDDDISKIVETVTKRVDVEKYATVVPKSEIEKNEYNLNVPRYVDTWEEEEIPDLQQVTKELIEIEDEIKETRKVIAEMLKELEGTTPAEDKYYKEAIGPLIKRWEGKDETRQLENG